MQKMLIGNDTPDDCACKPYQAKDVSFLPIFSLQLSRTPLSLDSYRLLRDIFRIFSATAIFTHAIDKNYLSIRASIGLSLSESLQYTDISHRIYVTGSLLTNTPEQQYAYIGAPIRNSAGRIVAVTTLLRVENTPWSADDIAFFNASIPYIEYQLAQLNT